MLVFWVITPREIYLQLQIAHNPEESNNCYNKPVGLIKFVKNMFYKFLQNATFERGFQCSVVYCYQ